MTDFRNLTQPHDLRSQLGLKNSGMTDERRISLGLPPLNEQNQESLRAEIADALRRDVKPLSPDEATPDPLHKIIAVTGCTNQDQARRLHKWFEGKHQPIGTSNVVVNVVNNGEPPTDQNAADIVANIRKMIDSPEVQRLRAIGQLTVDQASVLHGCSHYAVGGPINTTEPGNPIPMATNFRALPKVNDCLDTTESDVLELLALAGANPHTDRRRLDSARTQFELAFMMLKKAVDPEQERQ